VRHLCSQYGGGPSQRLSPDDRPLALQNAFLERLGYTTTVRRARLGIDPELRHLLRFHTGPATPQSGLEGLSRCGDVLVLKGLVFPQWRRRSIAVLQSRLLLYPGKSALRVADRSKQGHRDVTRVTYSSDGHRSMSASESLYTQWSLQRRSAV
jgi:hypothetical protein